MNFYVRILQGENMKPRPAGPPAAVVWVKRIQFSRLHTVRGVYGCTSIGLKSLTLANLLRCLIWRCFQPLWPGSFPLVPFSFSNSGFMRSDISLGCDWIRRLIYRLRDYLGWNWNHIDCFGRGTLRWDGKHLDDWMLLRVSNGGCLLLGFEEAFHVGCKWLCVGSMFALITLHGRLIMIHLFRWIFQPHWRLRLSNLSWYIWFEKKVLSHEFIYSIRKPLSNNLVWTL